MAKIWITYAWSDNQQGDVDFIAQEIQQSGAEVKLDRWSISAGKKLWQQIENFICSDIESDAWLLVATANSLSSEPCKEEFAYALDRALHARGRYFPVIGLFIGPVDESLIPAGIRTRLYVSITDPDWKERILAAAEGRLHQVQKFNIHPYHVHVHKNLPGFKPFCIEVRPRSGVWAPFLAGIPNGEKDIVAPYIMIGHRDTPTANGILYNHYESTSSDGSMWIMVADQKATPTESYYIWCSKLPSLLLFGSDGREPQYTTTFDN